MEHYFSILRGGVCSEISFTVGLYLQWMIIKNDLAFKLLKNSIKHNTFDKLIFSQPFK
jgi:hypothetical protein